MNAARWALPYETGTLRAVAKEDHEVVAEHELRTAGEPTRVKLDVDRETITPDRRDLVYIRATVTDEHDVRIPRAEHEIQFSVSGEGEIVGVDNGDLDSNESWTGDTRSAYHGTCIAVVQSARNDGTIEVQATSDGLTDDDVTILSC